MQQCDIAARLSALREYAILDTAADPVFDDITHLATLVCDVPIAVISFVDQHRVWYKSRIGLNVAETPIEYALCTQAIQQSALTIIPDTTAQAGSGQSHLVTHTPHVRFYAAAPLEVRPGIRIGTLSVMDTAPRTLTAAQQTALQRLCRQVLRELTRQRPPLWHPHTPHTSRDQHAQALAQSGQMFFEALNDPADKFLPRICEITATVVGCDFSHLLQLDPAHNVYRVIAQYGDPEPLATRLRDCEIPATPELQQWAEHARTEVLEHSPSGHAPFMALGQRIGIASGFLTTLSICGQVFGILTAGYRQSTAAVTTQQQHLFRAVADTASLAYDVVQRGEALQEAETVQKSLTAVMTHELRGTLAVVLGYSEILQDQGHETGAFDTDCQEMLRRMIESARSGLDIITIALELSRTELTAQADRHRDFVDTDIRELLHDVTQDFTLVKEKTSVPVSYSPVPDHLSTLSTDPVKLKMVLRNLVTNAVKFTDTGSVQLHTGSEGDAITFTVVDTGIGIPPEEVSFLFDPFTQAHGHTSRRIGGAGLGLYIVQRLVTLLGGTITVKSQVGRGSTFCVRVPCTAETSASTSVPLAEQRPFSLLVVDDDAMNRRVACRLLRKLGYTPDAVDGGAAALQAMEHTAYDAVFLDIHMPDIDGLAVARRVRADPPQGYTPYLIAMSADVLAESQAQFLAAGLDAFVGKPLDRKRLRHALDNVPTPIPTSAPRHQAASPPP